MSALPTRPPASSEDIKTESSHCSADLTVRGVPARSGRARLTENISQISSYNYLQTEKWQHAATRYLLHIITLSGDKPLDLIIYTELTCKLQMDLVGLVF